MQLARDQLLRAIPSEKGSNSCTGISSQHTCYYKRLQLKREEGREKNRHFNLVQLSQFSQDEDPWDIYLIYKGILQGSKHRDLKEIFFNSLWWGDKEGKRWVRRRHWKENLVELGEEKGCLLLYMFFPVINNLWKTVLTTSNAECFREMSGKKQTELAGMGWGSCWGLGCLWTSSNCCSRAVVLSVCWRISWVSVGEMMRIGFMLGLENKMGLRVICTGKQLWKSSTFTESVAASLPSLQLFTPPFPFHHVRASQLPFSALSPLCCSFMSTSLIVPPTLPCHIIPCSRDLTIERKKKGFSGVANETGKWKRRRREREDQREREQMLVAKRGSGSHLGESLTEGSLTLVSKFL